MVRQEKVKIPANELKARNRAPKARDSPRGVRGHAPPLENFEKMRKN